MPGSNQNSLDLCYQGKCVNVPQQNGATLALWLDPSTLPAAGMPVDVWSDRSGLANDAHSIVAGVPKSTGHGVSFPPAQGGMAVAEASSINFGVNDFFLLAVTNVGNETTRAVVGPGCMMSKTAGDVRQGGVFGYELSLKGQPTGSVNFKSVQGSVPPDGARHVSSLVRSGSTLDVRVDAQSTATLNDPAIAADTDTTSDLYVGACLAQDGFDGEITALIALTGAVGADEITAIEQFAAQAFVP
jgi:hypothetical protein